MNLITFIREMLNFIFESESFFFIIVCGFTLVCFYYLLSNIWHFIKRKFIDRG